MKLIDLSIDDWRIEKENDAKKGNLPSDGEDRNRKLPVRVKSKSELESLNSRHIF